MSVVREEGNATGVQESTPLLPREVPEEKEGNKLALYRALVSAFIVSLSFGVTQVPYARTLKSHNFSDSNYLKNTLCFPTNDM